MKRLLSCLITCLIAFSISAASGDPILNTSATSGIDIHAYMGIMCNVSIDILPNTGYEGAPFDIMGSDVWGKTSDAGMNTGRLVAKWSYRTNEQNRVLSIGATPLKNGETTINYRLVFSMEGTSDKLFVFSRIPDSPTEAMIDEYSFDFDINNYSTDQGYTINNPVASTNQNVRIILCDFNGSYDIVEYTDNQRNAWSEGNYTSTIYVRVKGN